MNLAPDRNRLSATDIYFSPEFLPSFETQEKQSEIFRQKFEEKYPQCTWEK